MQLQLPFPRLDIFTPVPESPVLPGPAIEYVRIRRARRYILRVRPDGTVRVTVPRGGSRREAQVFLRENHRWVERERQRVREQHAACVWVPGMRLLLRGEPVQLSVELHRDGHVVRYGDRRIEVQDAPDLRKVVEQDLRALAALELIPRLHELAAQHSLEVRRAVVRNQRSRWGSCSRSGVIALNFRLVQMPPPIRDYVLVHELMHIRQQNHSRRFWRLVEAAYPRFREAERWLRTEGRSLF